MMANSKTRRSNLLRPKEIKITSTDFARLKKEGKLPTMEKLGGYYDPELARALGLNKRRKKK